MKILLTGASSFTGYWFATELANAGHEVIATFTKSTLDQYDPLRVQRIEKVAGLCTPVWDCSFGDERFLELVREHGSWDLLCHHGAYVRDYRSLDFDVVTAVEVNTHNVKSVLSALVDTDCSSLLLTGSVFEQDEGIGEQPLRAFSPYGLSKGLTAQLFEYWCGHFGIAMGKFVIPNPFGPYEEKRFTAYLINKWLNDEKAGVNTPEYVRDNIHVSLLAATYRKFAEDLVDGDSRSKINPSGYVESQGAFAQRFADAMKPRLGKPCVLDLARQEVFDEPRVRVNFDQPALENLGWDEDSAWDAIAEYYLKNQPR